jgi:hypothetical protein
LRLSSVKLEGKELYVVQRAFTDIPEDERHSLVFGIGEVEPHPFHFLHWKQNTEDESETLLGTIHLKSGLDFLITTVSDPRIAFLPSVRNQKQPPRDYLFGRRSKLLR